MKYKYQTGAAIIGVSIIAALSAASSASATPTTAYHGDSDYTTVLWTATPHTDGSTPWPQKYVTETPGNNQYVYNANTPGLPCGMFYQADVYKTAHVQGLTVDGVLNDGEDNGKAIQWTTFTTPPCQTETTPPATTTPPVVVTPTSPVATNEPVPPTTPPATTPPVVTPTPTGSPTPVVTSPATPAATSTPPKPTVPPTATQTATTPVVGITKPTPRTADRSDASTPAATSLASTGSDASKPLLIGSLILATGLLLTFLARAAKIRRNSKTNR